MRTLFSWYVHHINGPDIPSNPLSTDSLVCTIMRPVPLDGDKVTRA